ncbi:MAG: FAD-dependent oxidoreductase [Pseudomonadota bacterium]
MPQPDVLIVGAGIFGLSAAFAAHRAGLTVQVFDDPGSQGAASPGLVGALTPHAPSRWRPMMAFQFNALLALARRADLLKDLTGQDIGYARLGRLTPLPNAKARERAERDIAAAPDVWGGNASMTITDHVPAEASCWLAPAAAEAGLVHDDLSARVDPRDYLAALKRALPVGTLRYEKVLELTASGVRTALADHSGAAVILAAGWQGWGLAPKHLCGSGVKGQAALLRVDHTNPPLIYDNGLYVIPHRVGTVAVGSTSQKTFEGPDATDDQLEGLIARAQSVCPALVGAPVIDRWAGVRPKPPGREPIIGPVPGTNVWMATGGFKIGFGIAHLAGDVLIDMITERTPAIELPETFLPASHEA